MASLSNALLVHGSNIIGNQFQNCGPAAAHFSPKRSYPSWIL